MRNADKDKLRRKHNFKYIYYRWLKIYRKAKNQSTEHPSKQFRKIA